MHVNAKKIAFGGFFLALTEIFLLMGSVIQINTLFLLAAASYFVGIMIREFDLLLGAAFYLAGVLLGLLLTPNLFYVCSYAAMGAYILAVEAVWRLLGTLGGGKAERKDNSANNRRRIRFFWVAKFLTFNCMFFLIIFFFREFLFVGKMSTTMQAGTIVAGQIGWLLYDRAYEWTQANLWSRMRGRLWKS